MAARTRTQILDEAVYAVACVAHHYGPALSESSLKTLRELLRYIPWQLDSTYRADSGEGTDFHTRIIWPQDWEELDPKEVAEKSYATEPD